MSSGTRYGWEMLRQRQRQQQQQRQPVASGTRVAGGGYVLGDTVMRDRDRPVDTMTQCVQDAAHAEGLLARPALRDFQSTNSERRSSDGDSRSSRWRNSIVSTAGAAMPYLLPVMPYPWNR